MLGLRSLKEALKRDSLRSPNHKGVLNYIERKLKPRKAIPDRHISIFLTTHCNLNCFSCGALGMDPRPEIEHTEIKDIELFLGIMQEIHPESYIMLTGGEPTLYPYLKKACSLIREFGFKPAMLTNGFKIVPLEWFDSIMIDYHGESNKSEIEDWKNYLEGSDILWDMHDKRYHKNIPLAMKGNISNGLKCRTLFEPLTLWKNVIYPCCNIMCLEWWHQDISTTAGLMRERWTVENEDFPETFRDWRETLPAEFVKVCSLNCWEGSINHAWVAL